mmetsp:Transcript_46489/g.95080  ORF Transcript_46489/g.95080 Transcript_46489/m.95080 type:complete len:87 (-) Transcript_46489:50-310(-)
MNAASSPGTSSTKGARYGVRQNCMILATSKDRKDWGSFVQVMHGGWELSTVNGYIVGLAVTEEQSLRQRLKSNWQQPAQKMRSASG